MKFREARHPPWNPIFSLCLRAAANTLELEPEIEQLLPFLLAWTAFVIPSIRRPECIQFPPCWLGSNHRGRRGHKVSRKGNLQLFSSPGAPFFNEKCPAQQSTRYKESLREMPSSEMMDGQMDGWMNRPRNLKLRIPQNEVFIRCGF